MIQIDFQKIKRDKLHFILTSEGIIKQLEFSDYSNYNIVYFGTEKECQHMKDIMFNKEG